MGSYTFKWEHPAEEVYVTGTFDNWTKSVKLDKRGDIFEKTVSLEIPSDKVYYKFVVDNNWTTNESSPKEADKEGNINNFLTSEIIAASAISTTVLNTIGPGSTTATMAGQQPLEKNKLASINPLPASETGVNPINLKPGEKVPQQFATGDIHKHVKLDKESYEKSDSLIGIPNPADVPAAGPNTIPESSLPMPQNATINTVGPGATTAALAGQVPLESKAAEPTSGTDDKKKKKNKKKNEKKKQKKAAAAAANGNGAGQSPEATANATAVEDKKAAESELLKEVEPVPATDGSKPKELSSQQGPAKDVPAEVKESIQEAGRSPEAAANATAVGEKKVVESELLKEVKPAPATEALKADKTPAVVTSVDKATDKPAEKPTEEIIKAPALATVAPIVAPITAHQAEPVEKDAAKVVGGVSSSTPAEPKLNETKVTVSKPVTLTPASQQQPADTTVAQATESQTTDVSAPKVAEVPKPAETTPAVSKPAQTNTAETTTAASKPDETKPDETKFAGKPVAATGPATNGSGSKPTPVAATGKGTATSKANATVDKKKGRLSTFISKIKGKLSDKN
ncbi:Cruciform DNA-recognizing protein 1 [Beauveria bassiana]|uniref:Cruciform DNA-recognizing protein 1 n=1 Tax=Beauveria bassiana TaxID=176275 RepID=A0A2N6NYY0_BEABA|nr:Cruciform DNA-recognizing protein 1 [Beauveria bassiana]